MYLVTTDIYKKLLENVDAREKKKVEDLNLPEMGNSDGAFPRALDSPDIHNNTSSQNDDGDDDDDDGGNDFYPPYNRRNTSSTETASEHNSSSTETASETERYLNDNPSLNDTNLSVQAQNTAFPLDDDDADFSSSFARHPNELKPASAIQFQQHALPSQPIQQQPIPSTSAQTIQFLSQNDISPELSDMLNKMAQIKKAALEQQKMLVAMNKKAVQKLKNNTIMLTPESIAPATPTTALTPSSNNQSRTFAGENIINAAKAKPTILTRAPVVPQPIGVAKARPVILTQAPVVPQPIGNLQNISNLVRNDQIQEQVISQSTSQVRDTGTRKKSYLCDLCNLNFATNRLLLQHQKDFHQQKSKKIDGIAKNKKNKYINWKEVKAETLVKAKKGKVKKDEEMDSVRVLSSDDTSMDNVLIPGNHSTSMESISVLQCKLCPATFNTEHGLERHLKNIHETDKNYISKQTHGKKRKIEDTNGNISEKTSDKKKQAKYFYKCKLCINNFAEKKALNRHLNNIHNCDSSYNYNLPQGTKRKRAEPQKSNKAEKEKQYKKWN
jgi:hypothetical protein